MWNDSLEELVQRVGSENASWFKGPWLFAECYMYRRVREAMLLCKSPLREYDPFEPSKHESHQLNQASVFQLINGLCPLDYTHEAVDPQLLHRRFQIIMEVLL
jgi:hypothetical protein